MVEEVDLGVVLFANIARFRLVKPPHRFNSGRRQHSRRDGIALDSHHPSQGLQGPILGHLTLLLSHLIVSLALAIYF